MSPMTAPTREQVIEWAEEAGAIQLQKDGWAPLIQGGIGDMQRFAVLAMEAGREQGLREAKEVILSKTHHPDDPNNCVWTAAYDHVAAEHVAAIEQLRGK